MPKPPKGDVLPKAPKGDAGPKPSYDDDEMEIDRASKTTKAPKATKAPKGNKLPKGDKVPEIPKIGKYQNFFPIPILFGIFLTIPIPRVLPTSCMYVCIFT